MYENNDWKAFGNACKSYTHRERIFNVKIQTGFLPTADRLHLFDTKHSSKCPCCGRLHESTLHVLKCNNPWVQEKRTKEIEKLEKWLDSNSTLPEITRTIVDTLMDNDSDKFSEHVPPDGSETLQQSARIQGGLGLMEFHRGHLIATWGKFQHEHFTSIFFNSKKKQTKWTERLIAKINSMNIALWHFRNSIAADLKKS